MKRLYVIITILAAIVLLEGWGLFWLKDYTVKLSGQLTTLSEQAPEEPEKTLQELSDLREEWKGRRRVLSIFIHEKVMDDFENSLTEAMLRLQGGDGESALWLRMAADAASEIWEREKPTIQNIL